MNDDYLDPDEILDPDDSEGGAGDGLDRLARRAVDSIVHLVRRANALAGGVLMFVTVAVVIGFGLGLAALSDGIRTVWIVLGGFVGLLAIVSVIRAMWRLRTVGTSADQLVGEVRTLMHGDRQRQRIIVETMERTDDGVGVSVVQLSQGFSPMRDVVGGATHEARHVASAVRAVTTFPAIMALATLVGVGFLGLSLIFLIALAL